MAKKQLEVGQTWTRYDGVAYAALKVEAKAKEGSAS